MHDLMFTKEIVAALKNKQKSIPEGSKITSVNASLSPLSHVKPETLAETFRTTAKGTEFEKTALSIKVLPLGIKCRSCKHGFSIDRPTVKCPKCNSADLDIVNTREFTVDSVEVSKI